jgi:hypothetical protein
MTVPPPGLIVDTTVTGDALVATLDRWLPTYLAHLGRLDRERRGDQGLTPEIVRPPRSWHRAIVPVEDDGVLWPDRALPAVYVVYDGLADDPVHDGNGKYSCEYRFEIAAVVQAADQDGANRLSQIYYAAIVGAIMQRQSLGGHAGGVTWRPGTAARRPLGADGRPLAVCGAIFDVTVPDVIDVFDGLAEPMPGTPPAAAPDRHSFESHDVTIEPREADET